MFMFFSNSLKKHIIKCTKENNCKITNDKLDAFIGILITSNFNPRKCVRDYWSNNDLLQLKRVSLVMSRDKFLLIKKKYKVFTKF